MSCSGAILTRLFAMHAMAMHKVIKTLWAAGITAPLLSRGGVECPR